PCRQCLMPPTKWPSKVSSIGGLASSKFPKPWRGRLNDTSWLSIRLWTKSWRQMPGLEPKQIGRKIRRPISRRPKEIRGLLDPSIPYPLRGHFTRQPVRTSVNTGDFDEEPVRLAVRTRQASRQEALSDGVATGTIAAIFLAPALLGRWKLCRF